MTISFAKKTSVNYASLDYSRWSWHQRIFQKVFALTLKLVARIHIEGFEHIPPTGPMVVASNHLHLFDVPLYFSIAPRRTICMISDNWRTKPFWRWFLTWMGQVIFVTLREHEHAQYKSNRRAISQSLTVLRSGGILGLAPEGGRSQAGLKQGLPGVAYMANRASVPILPAAIYGQERAWQCWKRLRRVPIYIRMGLLIEPPAQKLTTPELQTYTDHIMTVLAQLLPPEYRGKYQHRGQTESPN